MEKNEGLSLYTKILFTFAILNIVLFARPFYYALILTEDYSRLSIGTRIIGLITVLFLVMVDGVINFHVNLWGMHLRYYVTPIEV